MIGFVGELFHLFGHGVIRFSYRPSAWNALKSDLDRDSVRGAIWSGGGGGVLREHPNNALNSIKLRLKWVRNHPKGLSGYSTLVYVLSSPDASIVV